MNAFEVDVPCFHFLTSMPSAVLAAWDRDGDDVVSVPFLESRLVLHPDVYRSAADHQSGSIFCCFRPE